MKFLAKFLLAFVVVCLAIVFFAGGGVVKYMVNFHSERLTGLKMSLAGAEVNWLSGQLVLNNLAIANPHGFDSPHAATIENVYIKLQPQSLLEDVIVIDYVGVTGTHVQFEGDLQTNNVQEIQNVLNTRLAEAERQSAQVNADSTAGEMAKTSADTQALAIRQLSIKGTTLSFHLGGFEEGVTQKVSDIELTNIGTENKGASVAEVINKILVPLFNNMHKEVLKTLSNPEGLLEQVKDKLGGVLGDLF